MTNERVLQIARVVLRVALASAFLAAVADRFGLLGAYGSRNVSWGDWKHFEAYVAVLNWFLPKSLIPGLSAVETLIEGGLGIALLVGIFPRTVAWSSAALLSSFALTMSIALGPLAPLGYGVFTAVGAALLLGAVLQKGTDKYPFQERGMTMSSTAEAVMSIPLEAKERRGVLEND